MTTGAGDPDPLAGRLAGIRAEHADLERMLADPEVAADGQRVAELAREHARLGAIVAAADRRDALRDDAGAAREMAAEARDGDPGSDDAALMAAEAERLDVEADRAREELKVLLLPPDPSDGKDVIVEVRAAAGGDEAGLFAGELVDMYAAFASRQGWAVRPLTSTTQDVGGVKEASVEVAGVDAWGLLKHESGVHRVQRVPVTESQGRIHTSTASVAVLPVADEVDVAVDPNDLRIDVYRSSGPGGQSVNTTDSAVRVIHEPTGIVVSCQDEKSQHQNRDKALRILRSRLLAAEQERAAAERADARRGQIGTGDRSEKIRTYNFPQSRVTDHRIGLTVHNLDAVLAGELDDVVEALRQAERAQLLEHET